MESLNWNFELRKPDDIENRLSDLPLENLQFRGWTNVNTPCDKKATNRWII
jgi:hypothetical protein